MRKDKKLELKPWVTKEIKTSINWRVNLYGEAAKERHRQRKTKKYETSKKYRNKIVGLLKASKQTHCKKYFEENKKNRKAPSDGIHEIIYSKKRKDTFSPSSLLINGKIIIDKSSIVENLTTFFISIEKKNATKDLSNEKRLLLLF